MLVTLCGICILGSGLADITKQADGWFTFWCLADITKPNGQFAISEGQLAHMESSMVTSLGPSSFIIPQILNSIAWVCCAQVNIFPIWHQSQINTTMSYLMDQKVKSCTNKLGILIEIPLAGTEKSAMIKMCAQPVKWAVAEAVFLFFFSLFFKVSTCAFNTVAYDVWNHRWSLADSCTQLTQIHQNLHNK